MAKMAKKAVKKVVKKIAKRPARKVAPAPERSPSDRETNNALGTSTLRPGYLVSLRSSVTGNVKYNKEVIEPEHRLRSGASKAAWQTEKTVEDPEEHAKANQARMKARLLVAQVCAKSAFGYLCPDTNAQLLIEAIAEARRVVEAFNRRSRLTRVDVYVITGRVEQNDVEAIRAINSEVRDLLADMSSGIQNLDVKKVRDAANKARSIGTMLSPDASEKIKAALDAARGAARKIVKAGDEATSAIDNEAINTITQARSAFLDIDIEGDVEIPDEETRAVDLPADDEVEQPIARFKGKAMTAKGKRAAA